jgi:PAS domain S-box-containing protein
VAGNDELQPTDLGIGRLFYAIRDAVIVGDVTTGRIVLWNAVAADIFGYAPEQAVGQPITMLIPAALRERHVAGLDRFRSTGTGPVIGAPGPVELTGIRRDGREIPIELTLTPMADLDGGRRYVLAIVRDRTEAKAAEAERARSEQQRAMERMRMQFLQMASHEIRTPLTLVRGLVELAERRLAQGDADRAHRDLERATRGIDELARLVEDLFDVTRIEAGRFDVRPEPMDLAALAHEVGDTYARQGRRVDVRSPDRLGMVADPMRVRQIVNNLLRNAVAYSPPDSAIDIEISSSGGQAVLRVRDRGIGVPEDQRELIFRPFVRGENVGERRGTGLGLFISRRIAELHGGSLVLESAGPAGTTFALTLPLDASAHASDARAGDERR